MNQTLQYGQLVPPAPQQQPAGVTSTPLPWPLLLPISVPAGPQELCCNLSHTPWVDRVVPVKGLFGDWKAANRLVCLKWHHDWRTVWIVMCFNSAWWASFALSSASFWASLALLSSASFSFFSRSSSWKLKIAARFHEGQSHWSAIHQFDPSKRSITAPTLPVASSSQKHLRNQASAR